jgi:hypothetical protein
MKGSAELAAMAAAKQEAAALDRIEAATEPAALRRIMDNAERLGARAVYSAAFRRFADLSAEGEPGSIEHDFWRAIHALEAALSTERGKTTRLSRTRQKLARAGTMQTVADLASAPKPSDGFAMLIERGMWELTAEALVLRHTDRFSPETVDAARARLTAAGCDTQSLSPTTGA